MLADLAVMAAPGSCSTVCPIVNERRLPRRQPLCRWRGGPVTPLHGRNASWFVVRGSWIGVRRRFLDVSKGHASVQGGGDPSMLATVSPPCCGTW